jgi:hypothetical protein
MKPSLKLVVVLGVVSLSGAAVFWQTRAQQPLTDPITTDELSDQAICRHAINPTRSGWVEGPYAKEASRRGLTFRACDEMNNSPARTDERTISPKYDPHPSIDSDAETSWDRPDSRIWLSVISTVNATLTVMAYSQNRRGKAWGPYTPVYGKWIGGMIYCKDQEMICMGAWTEPTGEIWGIGDNTITRSCTTCCFHCDGGKFSWRLNEGFELGDRPR